MTPGQLPGKETFLEKTGNGWLWKYKIKNDLTASKNVTETKQQETIRNHIIKIAKEIRQKEQFLHVSRTVRNG